MNQFISYLYKTQIIINLMTGVVPHLHVLFISTTESVYNRSYQLSVIQQDMSSRYRKITMYTMETILTTTTISIKKSVHLIYLYLNSLDCNDFWINGLASVCISVLRTSSTPSLKVGVAIGRDVT